MLIWGTGGDCKNLGIVSHRHCETCEKSRPFDLVLEYRYWGLYWIFNFIVKKNYFVLCDICQRGWELHETEVEKRILNPPLPFMQRYGLAVFLGAFISLIAIAQIVM